MGSLLFIVIGFIVLKTLESCEVTMDMWQYWSICACVIASMVVTYFLM